MATTLIVIPAFNEQESLPAVLDELRRTLPDCDALVVDDGSADSTAAVARRHGAVVASLPFNLGIGGALRTGFRYAVLHGYDRVVQLDADGQHDPAEVKLLTATLDDGVDMAIGSRFTARESTYDVGRVRFGAMRLLRLAVLVLSGQRFTDTSSGFRAFSAPLVRFFADTYPQEYMESVEALLLACYEGFKVVEVPVLMRQRSAGVPSARNIRLLYHYLRLLIVMVTTAPLRSKRPRATG
ncbi:MAG: glycosyltransferase family 2 protein [Actinobacteria bacterium]|nr:glycosyltransferase family 2 protein [Actinomycetota bacterium]